MTAEATGSLQNDRIAVLSVDDLCAVYAGSFSVLVRPRWEQHLAPVATVQYTVQLYSTM
jgi:hypothetical protein